MTTMKRILSALMLVLFASSSAGANPLVYEGKDGPGAGKHIVFLAGDHEYRSEETLPALARILAKRHGFRCTVLFTLDKKSGEIVPGSSHMPGTEALKSADLMVIYLRFQDFPKEQMQPIVDYLARGGPVVGLRTSTHAFKIPGDSPYAKFSFRYGGQDFKGGFGRQIMGETWAGHYGKNHVMSTRLIPTSAAKTHPVMRGVEKPWVVAGGYWTDPVKDSTVLALAQPLQGMKIDSPPAEGKKPCPGAWVRTHQYGDAKGRVFSSTYGASGDILNEDYRRMLINACFWAVGLEDKITADLNVDFVGPYKPSKFRFGGYVRGVKPADLAGWESPIMPQGKAKPPAKKRPRKKANR